MIGRGGPGSWFLHRLPHAFTDPHMPASKPLEMTPLRSRRAAQLLTPLLCAALLLPAVPAPAQVRLPSLGESAA
jgi:hypothetical protein